MARISSTEIIAMGWGISTKAMSGRPTLFIVLCPRAIKALVTTVTVGMPSFSISDWSTTSHEVQDPQSPWAPMTRSGFSAEMTFASLAESSSDPL